MMDVANSAARLEMLALVEFIDHFRYHMLGRTFLIRTDHNALKWLMSFKQPEGQVARWLERLQEYDFDIEHRPGKSHANADAPSCKPRRKHGSCPYCGDTEFIAATTLLEDKRAGGTPESRESEFSWSADEFAEAQRIPRYPPSDYTNKGRKIPTHSERTAVPQSLYQSNICAVAVTKTGGQSIER